MAVPRIEERNRQPCTTLKALSYRESSKPVSIWQLLYSEAFHAYGPYVARTNRRVSNAQLDAVQVPEKNGTMGPIRSLQIQGHPDRPSSEQLTLMNIHFVRVAPFYPPLHTPMLCIVSAVFQSFHGNLSMSQTSRQANYGVNPNNAH
ncbi:hypothetical protein ACRALDRAFT_206745 [Sodiomyces alcalophilus JCM 7366]|uniref:uncharacterized protein n=1 Tax=Sodiomyces alcalophilus JCM 7366 TaxID=591952 RepID=UPI0039B54D0F